jgi:hypothetical protein
LFSDEGRGVVSTVQSGGGFIRLLIDGSDMDIWKFSSQLLTIVHLTVSGVVKLRSSKATRVLVDLPIPDCCFAEYSLPAFSSQIHQNFRGAGNAG